MHTFFNFSICVYFCFLYWLVRSDYSALAFISCTTYLLLFFNFYPTLSSSFFSKLRLLFNFLFLYNLHLPLFLFSDLHLLFVFLFLYNFHLLFFLSSFLIFILSLLSYAYLISIFSVSHSFLISSSLCFSIPFHLYLLFPQTFTPHLPSYASSPASFLFLPFLFTRIYVYSLLSFVSSQSIRFFLS